MSEKGLGNISDLSEHFSAPTEELSTMTKKLRSESPGIFLERDLEVNNAINEFPNNLKKLQKNKAYTKDYLVANIFNLRLEEGLMPLLKEFTEWDTAGQNWIFTKITEPESNDDRFYQPQEQVELEPEKNTQESAIKEVTDTETPHALYPGLTSEQSLCYEFLKHNNNLNEEIVLSKIVFPPGFSSSSKKSSLIARLNFNGYISYCGRKGNSKIYKINENSNRH